MIIALLDTNVLWPSLQRDFLLSTAAEGLFRPVWSDVVLLELEATELRKLVGRGIPEPAAAERSASLVRTLGSVFDDSLVTGWERLEGSFGLPDPDDEHVAAAAVTAGAHVLVTHNVKDFPPSRMPSSVRVATPADFAADVVTVDEEAAAAAVRHIARRSGRLGPPMSYASILAALRDRYGMRVVHDLLMKRDVT